MDARSDLGNAETTTLADREIFAERLLDAPRDLVFKVWTDTSHLEQWWGPAGFTTTTRRAQIQPGGEWRFVMHAPDGTDYENIITFVAVEAPARLAYRQSGDGETQPHFLRGRSHLHRGGGRDAPQDAHALPLERGARPRDREVRRARGPARPHRATARPPGAAGCLRHHAHLRGTPRPGVAGAYRDRAPAALVGPEGLRRAPRHARPAARWHLPLRLAHAAGPGDVGPLRLPRDHPAAPDRLGELLLRRTGRPHAPSRQARTGRSRCW